MSGDAQLATDIEEAQAIQALADAVQEGNAGEAEKLAKDLFSGSPENNERRFQLINEALQGIGHSAINQPQQRRKEEQAASTKRRNVEAILQATERNKNIKNAHPEMAETYGLIARIHSLIEQSNLTPEQKREALEAEERAIDVANTTSESLKLSDTIESEHKDQLTELAEQVTKDLGPEAGQAVQDFFTAELKLVTINSIYMHDGSEHSTCRYIVYQNAEGAFFVQDKDGQQRLITDIADNTEELETIKRQIETQLEKGQELGNQVDPELVSRYKQSSVTVRDILNQEETLHKNDKNFTTVDINEHIDKIIEVDALRSDLHVLKEQLEERLLELQNKVESEDPNVTFKDIQEEMDALEEISEQIKDKLIRLSSEQKELGANYSHLIQQLAHKIEETEKASEATGKALDKVEEAIANVKTEIQALQDKFLNDEYLLLENEITLEQIESNYANYQDRHDQLNELYGDWHTSLLQMGAKVLSALPFTDDIELTQERALEFAADNPEHKLVQAWENNVIHDQDGHVVFRSNEDGRLYTINDNGEQVFKTDIEEIIELRLKISEGQMVGNESPLNQYFSPFDSFEDTSHALLATNKAKDLPSVSQQQMQHEMAQLRAQQEGLERSQNKLEEHQAQKYEELKNLEQQMAQAQQGQSSSNTLTGQFAGAADHAQEAQISAPTSPQAAFRENVDDIANVAHNAQPQTTPEAQMRHGV